jgi:hypothetical protein
MKLIRLLKKHSNLRQATIKKPRYKPEVMGTYLSLLLLNNS